jgi:transcriptional regulator of acetoin/glycerol metabolism
MRVTGEFREDLYYRLNGILLELPPLQARADKENLIRRLLVEEGGKIDDDAFELLTLHSWPGNVRELRNVIRSAYAICDGGCIRAEDLPASLQRPNPTVTTAPPAGSALAQAECEALLSAIRANDGNLCHTARNLGISRNSLYRKLKRHGIGLSRVASPPKP